MSTIGERPTHAVFTAGSKCAAAASLLAFWATGPALAADLSDAEVLGIYIQVNSFDIETALLGEARGQSEEVLALGYMVSTDHTGVCKAAHGLAEAIGVVPVLPPARVTAARAHDAAVIALHLVGLVVNPADIQDRDGAIGVIASIRRLYPWLRRLFADGGYAGDKLATAWPNSAAGPSRSSSAPIVRSASRYCRAAGSSSAGSHAEWR